MIQWLTAPVPSMQNGHLFWMTSGATLWSCISLFSPLVQGCRGACAQFEQVLRGQLRSRDVVVVPHRAEDCLVLVQVAGPVPDEPAHGSLLRPPRREQRVDDFEQNRVAGCAGKFTMEIGSAIHGRFQPCQLLVGAVLCGERCDAWLDREPCLDQVENLVVLNRHGVRIGHQRPQHAGADEDARAVPEPDSISRLQPAQGFSDRRRSHAELPGQFAHCWQGITGCQPPFGDQLEHAAGETLGEADRGFWPLLAVRGYCAGSDPDWLLTI